MKGIILYGPPASGKDTITAALTAAEPRCQLFRRLKVGTGKTATYRMTTSEHLAELRARGEIAWENSRYDAIYAIDTPYLRQRLRIEVPVVHVGQIEAIKAIRDATPDTHWLTAALWCSRQATEVRLRQRNKNDIQDRLMAWDETVPLSHADLQFETHSTTPGLVAESILSAIANADTGSR